MIKHTNKYYVEVITAPSALQIAGEETEQSFFLFLELKGLTGLENGAHFQRELIEKAKHQVWLGLNQRPMKETMKIGNIILIDTFVEIEN